MKAFWRCLIVSMLLAGYANAENIYKNVDPQGNPAFSDTPSKGAEKITVDPVLMQSVPTAAPSAIPKSAAEQPFHYSSLAITRPENDTTHRNQTNITVSASLKPELHSDHRVVFLNNGQPVKQAGRSLSVSLPNPDRGSHSLQAQVIDANGEIIIASPAVTIYVHQSN